MKKQKLILIVWWLIFFPSSSLACVLISCPFQGFGVGIDPYCYLILNQDESEDVIYKRRLQRLFSPVELTYNRLVRKQIDCYLKHYKREIGYWVGLSSFYFPIIQRILEAHHIPQELIYLTLIESSLNPSASSLSGPSGLWQFTITTGKLYGLEINYWMDERMDILKSTEAVCLYLRKLYQIYNDWILVIATYNCGIRNVQKAMLRARNHTNYQAISPYLPNHTRYYITRFIALNYLMNYYAFHQIQPIIADCLPMVDTTTINYRIRFDQLSAMTHVDKPLLHRLNPQYSRDLIPGDSKSRVILLPVATMGSFTIQKESIKNPNHQLNSEGSGRRKNKKSI